MTSPNLVETLLKRTEPLDPDKLEQLVSTFYELDRNERKRLDILKKVYERLEILMTFQKAFPDIPLIIADMTSAGYRPPTRAFYNKHWSRYAKARLPYGPTTVRNSQGASDYREHRVITVAKFEDIHLLELTEPLFLEGAPWGKVRSAWKLTDYFDTDIPAEVQAKWLEEEGLAGSEDLEELRERRREHNPNWQRTYGLWPLKN
jgi:hypothetical protein